MCVCVCVCVCACLSLSLSLLPLCLLLPLRPSLFPFSYNFPDKGKSVSYILTVSAQKNQRSRPAIALFFVWQLTKVKHRNLTAFYGLCLDGDSPSVLWEYCCRGSIQVCLRVCLSHCLYESNVHLLKSSVSDLLRYACGFCSMGVTYRE